MTQQRESAAGALDYLVLALVCATAVAAGILEVMLVPLYSGDQIIPITVLLGMGTMFGLPRLGIWLTGTMSGAVLPVVSWFIPTLGLTLVNRPEGDVLVPGGNAQQWVLFALIIAGAIVGFTTVVRSAAALAPLQRRPGPNTTVSR